MSDEIASLRQREKLRALLRDRGISLRKMSIDLGLNESYFQQFVTYGRPNFVEGRILRDAARYLNVSEDMLSPTLLSLQDSGSQGGFSTGDYRPTPQKRNTESALVVLPCYDLSQGFEASDDWRDEKYQTQHFALSRQMVQYITPAAPENLVMMHLHSDTMSPTLNQGDCIVLDCSYQSASEDGIYVILHENRMLIKRITIDPIRKQLTLSRDNPNYPAIREFDMVNVKVAGRVVWAGKRL